MANKGNNKEEIPQETPEAMEMKIVSQTLTQLMQMVQNLGERMTMVEANSTAVEGRRRNNPPFDDEGRRRLNFDDEFETPNPPGRDSNLGHIKIKIPQFEGRSDPDAYLAWEKRVENIF